MTYKRFEDLPVWNAAIDLAVQVYALTSKPQFSSQRSLKDQIERAAVSVSNNIAEGFERGTNNELLAFLYIARGSAGEVRSMLCFASAPATVPRVRSCDQTSQGKGRELLETTEGLGPVASRFRFERPASR